MLNPNKKMLAEEIIDVGRRFYGRGRFVSKSGKISCLQEDVCVLIAPSRLKKSYLKPEEMCVIAMDGAVSVKGRLPMMGRA